VSPASGVHFSTTGPTNVITQKIVLDPEGTSGWHAHPGLVLVTVVSGAINFYDPHCNSITYAAGEAFIEPEGVTGMVTNDGPGSAEFLVTLVVPAGAAPRIDRAAPC
jgi:quercetin dioxygenase-like cupin family protein